MKRFQNILVIYDLCVGSDETLQRGLTLARQNDARLTVLHIVDPKLESMEILFERRKLMNRLFDQSSPDKAEFDVLVKFGDKINEILECVSMRSIDLIVAPTEQGRGFEKLIGTDLTAELMRATDCPIWVVRPGGSAFYRRIVAAVNAGKEDALTCPANRRILEMASSLAKREGAELDILYVWDYDGTDSLRLSSEVHDETRHEIYQTYRYQALEKVVDLTRYVLGEPFEGQPVVDQGDVEDGILGYVQKQNADLLVTEGSPGSPLMNAILGNRSLRILNQANCSVLLSRPADELEAWSYKRGSFERYSHEKGEF